MRVFMSSNFITHYGTLSCMKCPKIAIFDLDDTLAESFQPPKSEMIDRLEKLLEHIPVAIISAAGFPRIER